MRKLNLGLYRNIVYSKGQFISILLIVVVGLFVFTAMTNASANLETSLLTYYEETSFADLYVQVMKIPSNEIHKFEKEQAIEAIEGRNIFEVPFITDDDSEKVNVRIISVKESKNQVNQLYLHNGTRKINGKEVLVLQQFAQARFIEVGDEVTLQISGQKLTFNVGGIVSSPEYTYLMENEQSLMPNPEKFGVIYIEEDYLAQITNMKGQYNDVILKVSENTDLEKIEDKINETWDRFGVKRIIHKEDQLSNSVMQEEISGLKQTSKTLPFIFLIGAAAVLAAMMSRMVKNDRLTIGILKALGYTNLQVLFHYTKYAIIIGIVGGVLGTVLGTLLSGFMTKMYLQFFYIPMLTVRIYLVNIIVSVIMSIMICFIAGYLGAKKVLKISPAESMRPEPPKQGNRILLEKATFIWRKISFTWKIVLRNIFREKRKFILISLGAAFTLAMMISVFWMNDIFNTLFNIHYGKFMQMDYTINFTRPLSKNVLKDLDQLIETDVLEGKMEFPFELKHGRNAKIVNIIGLEENTEVYHFTDKYNNVISLPKEGILLSSNLADALGVKIGDKILIHNYIPGRDDVYIKVKGIIKQSLGINGYMNLDYMESELIDDGAINGAYVKTNKNIITPLQDVKNISSIQSQNELKAIFYEFIDLMVVSIVFMLMFSGLLGFVIIYSMTTMSINERQMEFSSLRVLGFTKREIFGIILKENFVMSLIGVIIGIPMGFSFANSIGKSFSSDLYTLNDPINVKQIILGIIVTTFFLTLAQLVTFRKIKNLNFLEALKSRTT